MYVDWPLAGFMAICLLAATLTCQLLVHTVSVSFKVIRAALERRRVRPRVTNATFDLGERSSP